MTEEFTGRSFEPGGNSLTRNPKNGFDLFVCRHHGHRVTSHECGKYKKSGACPDVCEKHPETIDKPEPATIQPEIIQKPAESQQVELFPFVKKYARDGIYFSTTPGGPITHKRCSACGKTKPKKDFYFWEKTGKFESSCIQCIAVRDARRAGREPKKEVPDAPKTFPTRDAITDIAGIIRKACEPALCIIEQASGKIKKIHITIDMAA